MQPMNPALMGLVESRWRKSSFSNGDSCCVEAAIHGGNILLRDTKYRRDPANDPDREPILLFTPGEWDAFLAGIKAGEFEIEAFQNELG